MSTRANIIVRDDYGQIIFYKHSDGYPEEVEPTLNKLLEYVKSGKLRNNVSQFSGWLILFGAIEYNTIPKFTASKPVGDWDRGTGDLDSIEDIPDWKVGAYEPTTGIHGNIDYLYLVDLKTKSFKVIEDDFDKYKTHKRLTDET